MFLLFILINYLLTHPTRSIDKIFVYIDRNILIMVELLFQNAVMFRKLKDRLNLLKDVEMSSLKSSFLLCYHLHAFFRFTSLRHIFLTLRIADVGTFRVFGPSFA